MQGKKLSSIFRTALVMVAVVVFATSAWASQVKVLHSFGNGTDGAQLFTGMIFDTAGNLYGVTFRGGIYNEHGDGGLGTVFELMPQPDGSWTEKVLHSFGHGQDGFFPVGGLVMDAAGNLYGTTESGGFHNTCNLGCGTVFELMPQEDGSWTEKVLHSFGNGTDGIFPEAGLVMDAAGNLYGTTTAGGIHDCSNDGLFCGTVFELSPRGDGTWTERVLHSFGGGQDGLGPRAGVTFDSAGNLYGTTFKGGIHNTCYGETCGTVFELSPNGSGGWTERVLHSFNLNGTDGYLPYGGVILDTAGNLYGTTYGGGIHDQCGLGCGTVFELSPRQDGGWTEKVLHSFNNRDGANPAASLVFDISGNLYGTTQMGGVDQAGAVFELTPNGRGGWTDRVLHNFSEDGSYPYSNLILDATGNLYGTAYGGGINLYGIVFEITP